MSDHESQWASTLATFSAFLLLGWFEERGTSAPEDASPVDSDVVAATPLEAGLLAATSLGPVPLDVGPLGAGPLDVGPLGAGPLGAGPLTRELLACGLLVLDTGLLVAAGLFPGVLLAGRLATGSWRSLGEPELLEIELGFVVVAGLFGACLFVVVSPFETGRTLGTDPFPPLVGACLGEATDDFGETLLVAVGDLTGRERGLPAEARGDDDLAAAARGDSDGPTFALRGSFPFASSLLASLLSADSLPGGAIVW